MKYPKTSFYVFYTLNCFTFILNEKWMDFEGVVNLSKFKIDFVVNLNVF